MRWVALLRAVNLGARNKVPMAELRARLEAAGYGDVRTYVASGNVLLDGPRSAAALSAELESLIADAFGVAATVMLRKPRELAALVAAHPYGADTSETHVAFLAARPAKAAAARLEVAGADVAVLARRKCLPPTAAGGSRLPPLGCTHREVARCACHASQLAHRDDAGRARRRRVGSHANPPRRLEWHSHVSFRSRESARTGSRR